MQTQVISIERKKYAIGLFWQPIAVGFFARSYARTLVRGIDRKLSLYTQYRSMVGLGGLRTGHRSGMPSAAAEVMESFAEFSSFLAVFQVSNTFWLVAVRNGIILSDTLFTDEDTARKEYIRISSMPDWGALFAPGSWGMPRAVERLLDNVITGNVKATLKPISRLKTDIIAMILFIVFVLGVAYFFKGPISQMLTSRPQISNLDPVLAENYKKKIEEKNKELDARFEIKKERINEPTVMPYDLLPNPMERAILCYQATGFLMQPIPGWVQTKIECNQTHASVTFVRTFGNLADFFAVATDIMPGAFVQEKTESEIFIRAKLPMLMASPSMDERDVETIARDVNTLFQRINTPVDVNITIDTIEDMVQIINLNVVEVGVNSKLTPPEFIKIFDGFYGLYMTNAGWDVKSRTWNYEVIIYAK